MHKCVGLYAALLSDRWNVLKIHERQIGKNSMCCPLQSRFSPDSFSPGQVGDFFTSHTVYWMEQFLQRSTDQSWKEQCTHNTIIAGPKTSTSPLQASSYVPVGSNLHTLARVFSMGSLFTMADCSIKPTATVQAERRNVLLRTLYEISVHKKFNVQTRCNVHSFAFLGNFVQKLPSLYLEWLGPKKPAEKILSSRIKTERKVSTFQLHEVATFCFNHFIKMSPVVKVWGKFNKNWSKY